MRTAWFHCFNGVAGDMTLGALLDAGADLDAVRIAIEALDIDQWALEVERTQRCGIAATRALVTAPDLEQHRPHHEVRRIVIAADLPGPIATHVLAAFAALAEVEGAIHGVDPDQVEFHEVGSLDAVVDIVGTCAALESLGIGSVACSPITMGTGTFSAAHGILPNPGPAVLSLLQRAGAPHRSADVPAELATPTGVALMTTLARGRFGPMPDGVVQAIGYGAGGRDMPGRPNVVQVVIIEEAERTVGSGTGRATDPTAGPQTTGSRTAGHAIDAGQPVRLLEANVDDTTGEILGHAVAALLVAGAHDAWVTPIVMKKGRPAHTVHALCDPSIADRVGAVLVAETGSLGLRGSTIERWPQQRSESTVAIEGHAIRVKVSAGGRKPEFDDALAASKALGVPVREILRRAAAEL